MKMQMNKKSKLTNPDFGILCFLIWNMWSISTQVYGLTCDLVPYRKATLSTGPSSFQISQRSHRYNISGIVHGIVALTTMIFTVSPFNA
jgi:hypothetical protein